MAWRRPGDKSLSEPMIINLLTHICVTLPQWVKTGSGDFCCHSARGQVRTGHTWGIENHWIFVSGRLLAYEVEQPFSLYKGLFDYGNYSHNQARRCGKSMSFPVEDHHSHIIVWCDLPILRYTQSCFTNTVAIKSKSWIDIISVTINEFCGSQITGKVAAYSMNFSDWWYRNDPISALLSVFMGISRFSVVSLTDGHLWETQHAMGNNIVRSQIRTREFGFLPTSLR